MPISNKNVASNIVRERVKRGMTQQQLASALGVSHQAVSKWETGAALPDLETLLNLSHLFGVTVEQLLSEAPETDDTAQEFENEFDFDTDVIVEGLKEAADRTIQTARGIGDIIAKKVSKVFEQSEPQSEATAPEAGEPYGADSGTTDHPSFDLDSLIQLAPFMSRDKVSSIVLSLDEEIPFDKLIALAPFVRQDALFKLILKNADKLNLEKLKKLAPFLKSGMVDMLVDVVYGLKSAAQPDPIVEFAGKAKKGMVDFISKLSDTFETITQSVSKPQSEDKQEADEETAGEAPDDDAEEFVEDEAAYDNAEEAPDDEDDGTVDSDIELHVINIEMPQYDGIELQTEDEILFADALKSRSWDWIRLNLNKIGNDSLLAKVAMTAVNELDGDDARDMLLNVAPYLSAESFKALLIRLCETDHWGQVCDLCSMSDSDCATEVLILAANAGKKALDAVRLYAAKAKREVWNEISQNAINESNWELVNALTENI